MSDGPQVRDEIMMKNMLLLVVWLLSGWPQGRPEQIRGTSQAALSGEIDPSQKSMHPNLRLATTGSSQGNLSAEIDALCYIAKAIPKLLSNSYGEYYWACDASSGNRLNTGTILTSPYLNWWCAGAKGLSSCCYNATGGDTNVVNTCKGTCQFFGVSCDSDLTSATFGSVTSIKLTGLSLSGSLSSGSGAFSDLSALKSLDVSYNNLGMALPNELTKLTNLKKLLLNDNKFTGTMPLVSGTLATFASYDYSDNCFTAPVAYLTSKYHATQYTSTYCAPTGQPTSQPSRQPSIQPSRQPSAQPTRQPTQQPTRQPTAKPSNQPTVQPSVRPSAQPSQRPTLQPSGQPTRKPSRQPTAQPSTKPSGQPSRRPSGQPSHQPTRLPTSQPTTKPTKKPIPYPTTQPTEQPTHHPTQQPSSQPTARPSNQPSTQPSQQPTTMPSINTGVTLNVRQQIDGVALSVALTSDFVAGYKVAWASCLGVAAGNINIRQVNAAATTAMVASTHTRALLGGGAVLVNADIKGPSGKSTQTLQGFLKDAISSGALTTALQKTGFPGAAGAAATKALTLGAVGPPTGQPTQQPTMQPMMRPSGQPSMQPTSQPTAQPTTRPTNGVPTVAFNYTVMAAVCTSTAFLLVLMGLVAYNGYLYPNDHVSCETFLTVYLCYDRYGLEVVKDTTYADMFPCCECSWLACTCCKTDENHINGGDWRVSQREHEAEIKYRVSEKASDLALIRKIPPP